MNAKPILRRTVTVASALAIGLTTLAPTAARAGYPLKCEKQTVLVVPADGTATSTFPTIGEAVNAASGDPAGSSVGDTVIVCPGEYHENVLVPQTDDNDNTNLSIRSWNGPHEVTIVGDLSAADAVVDIRANGVYFGGAGLGFTIVADTAPEDEGSIGSVVAGIQVGDPVPDPDLEEDDDQDLSECDEDPMTDLGKCTDEEKPALNPINVTVAGNEINGLVPAGYTGAVAGVAVNNTNNTLVFRNLIEDLGVAGSGLVFGIRYSDTNSNVEILQNAVKELSQSGGDCAGSTLAIPTVGAVGIAVEDEALDALFFNNKVEKIEATCTAIGLYSDAWGGLENDRNGQQIPIATDVFNNGVKKVAGAESAGVVLAPVAQTNSDGEEVAPPSSFRVSTNDFDDTGIAVAVLQQLAMYSYVEQNNFDKTEVGVYNDGNTNLDATNNYWGCDEGPRYISGKKDCADAVTMSGTTYVHPWLKSHVDHAGAHAGDHAGHN